MARARTDFTISILIGVQPLFGNNILHVILKERSD
jgi:hypothetical protein